VPKGIGNNILPAQVLEIFVAVGGLYSPLKVSLRGNWQEWYTPVPFSVAEGPANAKQLQQDRNHRSPKVARATVVADGLLKVLHLLHVIFVMFRVGPTIPILRIAMIANGELGKPDKVPVETIPP
jgi:hypothetical protein